MKKGKIIWLLQIIAVVQLITKIVVLLEKVLLLYACSTTLFSSILNHELPEILGGVGVLDMGYCWTVLENDEDYHKGLAKNPVEIQPSTTTMELRQMSKFDGLLVTAYHLSSLEVRITTITYSY